jgi:iron complex outermembrane recepter protein
VVQIRRHGASGQGDAGKLPRAPHRAFLDRSAARGGRLARHLNGAGPRTTGPSHNILGSHMHFPKLGLPALALVFALVSAAAPPPAAAVPADTLQGPTAAPASGIDERQTGSIIGVVVDANSGEPISTAYVRVREIGRNELSHGDGSFHFLNLAPRSYTILAQRIGFAPAEARVAVRVGEVTELRIELTPSALEVSGIVVTGTGRERGAGETYRPTTVVGDAELRRRLEASVAATIAHVPGISQQYNGPAAAQPVVRGMGGDRVLVLEDGQRTADLSTTGADHAVMIDPLTAKRIEVVRGPAGMLYGSNALGGVINVVREDVPRTLPEGLSGAVSMQVESVNRGLTGGAALLMPHGNLALRGELSGRTAGDTHTPEGVLPSTDLRAHNGGLGASWIASWGFVGASFRDYGLDYGVPGEFQGEVIPGAHPGGVRIESSRRAGRLDAGHFLGFGPVSSISLDANLAHYRHEEIEGVIDGDRVVGASFDNLAGTLNLLARHVHELEQLFTEGAVGLWANVRDLRAAGPFTGSRTAGEVSLAGYVYEELAIDPFRLQLGGRYDWTRVTPRDLRPIRTGERDIAVRERSFGALSASVAALVEPRSGWIVGASLARAFRNPSIEELYSDGPHLADFSYDIGNPELEPEFGLGGDIFLRVTLPQVHAEVSVFRNLLSDYIHHAPTAQLDPRFHRFPIFEATQADAVFEGAEAGLQWAVLPNMVVDGTVAYVRATRRGDGDPLPAIPPLNGSLRARYEAPVFFLMAGWDGARAQTRIPSPIPSPVAPGQLIHPERPTPAHNLLNVGGGIRWDLAGRLHTITLQIDNATDAVWRDHLSRVKDVAPQPGRNAQLLYRVQF